MTKKILINVPEFISIAEEDDVYEPTEEELEQAHRLFYDDNGNYRDGE